MKERMPEESAGSEKIWFFLDANQSRHGPYSRTELESHKDTSESTYVWHEGLPNWIKLNETVPGKQTKQLQEPGWFYLDSSNAATGPVTKWELLNVYQGGGLKSGSHVFLQGSGG